LDHALAEQSVCLQQPDHPRGNAGRRRFAYETFDHGDRHQQQHDAVVGLRHDRFHRHAAGDFHRHAEQLQFVWHRLPAVFLVAEFVIHFQPDVYGQRRGRPRLWWIGVWVDRFDVYAALRHLESLFQPDDALVRRQFQSAFLRQQFKHVAVQQHKHVAVQQHFEFTLWRRFEFALVWRQFRRGSLRQRFEHAVLRQQFEPASLQQFERVAVQQQFQLALWRRFNFALVWRQFQRGSLRRQFKLAAQRLERVAVRQRFKFALWRQFEYTVLWCEFQRGPLWRQFEYAVLRQQFERACI
jgi:hypothetical protein